MDKPMDAAQIFQRLAELAGAYRDGQAEGGYVTYLPPAELARRLELDRPAPPGDWDEIFRWVELYLRYSVKTGHPGYMNRMWSSANLPSVLGEMVTALSNTSACTFETAPVSTLMEQYLLQAMLDLVGFPKGSGQMTTGSSNANLIVLLIARNQASQAKNKGLFAQQELFAFVNCEAHYSFDRAANVLGLGSDHLIKIPVDEHGRMRTDALEAELARVTANGGRPFFVCATQGTTVRGAFDPVAPLLPLREKYGFWLHCDGAWGGPVIFSQKLRAQFLPHLEKADSFTLDFHKMPGTALMCNFLLLRGNMGVLQQTLSAGDETYIFRSEADGSLRDLGTLSLQCGRRVDSLKAFLDWKFYGRAGFAARVEDCLSLAEYAEERVQALPELEMVAPRESFNLCFRFCPPAGVDAAALLQAIRSRMQREGRYLVGTGFVGGELAMRFIATNPAIGRPEIDAFLQTVVQSGKTMLAEQAA